MLRTSATAAIMSDKRGGETPLAATGWDGPYARFALPPLAQWKCSC
ncbi:MAG: hypothetical protein MUC88_25520 [Planctomycetes bacterium]|jgi:hypothetical protein|nr:hypothetical protein [Planctomycetota bacterium]